MNTKIRLSCWWRWTWVVDQSAYRGRSWRRVFSSRLVTSFLVSQSHSCQQPLHRSLCPSRNGNRNWRYAEIGNKGFFQLTSIIACLRLRVIKYARATLGGSSSKDNFGQLSGKPQPIFAPILFSLPMLTFILNKFLDEFLPYWKQNTSVLGSRSKNTLESCLRRQQPYFTHLLFLCLFNEFLSKWFFTLLPLIFMIGVHPPSPHPKSPMWQKTEVGFESKCRVTSPLFIDLLNKESS